MGLFNSVKNAFSGSETSEIWEMISDPSQVDPIIEASNEKPQLIYKHSHRCSVCFVAKGDLEMGADDIKEHADMHFVNVVRSRDASNEIASELDVRHESPQAILVDNSEVVWHGSHGSIDTDTILKKIR
ncbi:bacillithiol system redox-active protein YtxJ [Fodinibius sp.]|uniref:bacillithiol system redox-active protein YtxJ n=1 Tax=Fodinibius sp. TaxID=1872440 RepID=UPI002ACDE301|nr:bacillithiol system redox-active protein YtxJ [Fodinibius sp.]MDZ7657917.1 bacillithiol system redox-active protein YtxJ [Fodinibius sp.]